MMAPGLVALWIGLVVPASQAGADAEPARTLEVAVDRLEVRADADDAAFVTSRLARGDKVEVRKAMPGGWVAIAAPRGTFHWVDDDAVDILRDGRVYVDADKTTLRLAREGLQEPGPRLSTLLQGAILRPARQPNLAYGSGRRPKVWRAVLAGPDDVRFVRAAGLIDPASSDRPEPRPPAAERLVSLDATAPALPGELVAPLRKVEGDHRSAVTGPVDRWDLDAVRGDYQTLLAHHGDPPAQAAIRDRLALVSHDDELAKTAREFEALVRKSRQRDVVLERVKASIRDLRAAEAQGYDAEGLLQKTARRVDGERVYSLLDDQGQIVAYLQLPTGIDTLNLLARQVGVRGKSRFNEGLRYRLLEVSDIEPLDRGR